MQNKFKYLKSVFRHVTNGKVLKDLEGFCRPPCSEYRPQLVSFPGRGNNVHCHSLTSYVICRHGLYARQEGSYKKTNKQRWPYLLAIITSRLVWYVGTNLYHAAAILEFVGNKGFVFASSLPVQPHTEWEVRRAKSFVSTLSDMDWKWQIWSLSLLEWGWDVRLLPCCRCECEASRSTSSQKQGYLQIYFRKTRHLLIPRLISRTSAILQNNLLRYVAYSPN